MTLLHSEANLRSNLTPFYLELFNTIARLEGGIKFLVDLRGDLLASQQQLRVILSIASIPRSQVFNGAYFSFLVQC